MSDYIVTMYNHDYRTAISRPLTRCRDCMSYVINDEDGLPWCEEYGVQKDGGGFCDLGAPKEEAEE